jgi:16S rRNA (guanine(966)-N(2))-methyltransferase RsmD
MRIIAGTHRGRRLHGPRGTALRPTSDRVREALFSILGSRLPGSRFLDLYAGTGAVGMEAASRGARQVVCVESNRDALKLLQRNLSDCEMINRVMVQRQTVNQFFSRVDEMRGPYDIVFADPPYAAAHELAPLLAAVAPEALFAPDARLVAEHAAKAPLPDHLGPCAFLRRYTYGDTALSVYAYPSTTAS